MTFNFDMVVFKTPMPGMYLSKSCLFYLKYFSEFIHFELSIQFMFLSLDELVSPVCMFFSIITFLTLQTKITINYHKNKKERHLPKWKPNLYLMTRLLKEQLILVSLSFLRIDLNFKINKVILNWSKILV